MTILFAVTFAINFFLSSAQGTTQGVVPCAAAAEKYKTHDCYRRQAKEISFGYSPIDSSDLAKLTCHHLKQGYSSDCKTCGDTKNNLAIENCNVWDEKTQRCLSAPVSEQEDNGAWKKEYDTKRPGRFLKASQIDSVIIKAENTITITPSTRGVTVSKTPCSLCRYHAPLSVPSYGVGNEGPFDNATMLEHDIMLNSDMSDTDVNILETHTDFLPWHRGYKKQHIAYTSSNGFRNRLEHGPGLHDSVQCIVGGTSLRKRAPLGGTVWHSDSDTAAADEKKEICSENNPRDKIVRIIYKNSSAVCTGTLIGPSHVLTAGHCLYQYKKDDPDNTGWLDIKGILLTPCNSDFEDITDTPDSPRPKNWQDAPIDFGWEWARTVKGWTKNGKWEYDYGMIKLKLPPEYEQTGRGWMSFGYDNLLPKYSFNLNGYPGASAPTTSGDYDNLQINDKNGNKIQDVHWTGFELAWDYDKTHAIKDRLLEYYMDTWGGQSGSAVYAYFKDLNARIIYGIHRGWDGESNQGDADYNVAKRITAHTFAQLCAWINDERVC